MFTGVYVAAWAQAYNSFVHLKRLPPARSGIEMKKLDAHIEFCSNTFAKAQVRRPHPALPRADTNLHKLRRER